ncbi:TIGR02270 family protein [Pseudomonas aeruginosa]|uniref:TIGR02270 family protein n=1 Tax=Pseudomonas aeruginosa TaxID=287 RepID=UPI001B38F589|nr:TIGR02270 family protein [Pseudomonas aeruginosa]MBP8415958.1 TIGR02270 family protein [Pseudomonas aeruginosa]
MDAHRLSIAAIVDQHAEEAAFLALLRDYAVRAPHYDLEELAELDQRIEAHLDGLAIAGQAGHDALLEQLDAHAQGEAFALAVLAMQAGDDALIGRMRACLAASPEARRGFAAALGWLDWDQARPWVERLLASPEPLFRAIGLAACGMHRHDPGPALLSALGHADPAVLARAARTAGELRRRDLMANIRAYCAHDDPSLRFWANWATAQMGDEEALGPLRAFAGQPGPFQLPATMVLLAWQPRDTSMDWIRQLMQAADTRRIGIQATGLFGDPVAVPWLIQQMRDESLARVAGEAFSLITGADLALLDLELEVLPDYDPGPNDDPDDDNVALDDDENLSWPEAERVSAWWRDNGARFVAGRAYLLGEPLGEAHCRQVLRDGQQRQRMAAACLLARFVPNLPLFPTGAPVRRQLDLF